MIALEWLRRPEAELRGDRLSAALTAGTSGVAGQFRSPRSIAATLLPAGDPRRARNWRPAELGPLTVLFAGHLDNAAAAAAALGQPTPAPGDTQALAQLYAAALLHWGERTDRELIGEYATITLDGPGERMRLARSPLRAPPLHYHLDEARVVASPLVRALFACGVERQIDRLKLADTALFNFSEESRGWFSGIRRVPLGSVVQIDPAGDELRQYYDLAALPRTPRAARAELVEQAAALLAEGTRAALAGSRKPAIMLSGGLDSSLVAVNVLGARPEAERLNTYSFVAEPGSIHKAWPGRIVYERPAIEAFCAMHPRLVPHFHDNAGMTLDAGLSDMFFALGSAPQGLANLASYHALWQAARADGCDRVLLGEFGNMTASADGSWAYGEYLATLRWGELVRSLRGASGDGRSLLRRFVALAVLPFLPDGLWHWQRRLRGVGNLYHRASPLRRDFAERSGALERSRRAGRPNPRFPLRDRLAMIKEVHGTAWGEFSDIYAGFGQRYGMEQRDPYAYRPFFEFCAGLPSDMFLYRGQNRWLARTLLAGQMPEAARLDPRTAIHNPDWHAKLTPQRTSLLREFKAMRAVPELAGMIDCDRMIAALEDWPENDDVSDAERVTRDVVLPRAVIMARFVNYVEGRNLEL